MSAPASGRDLLRRQVSLGLPGFVALMAAIMALQSVAVDAMLPAMPEIARGLGLGTSNRVQLVVTAYMLGFAFAQLIYGVVSDRFGRKPILLIGVAIYTVFGFLAGSAPSFEMMIAMRAIQGAGAASTRVLGVSMTRDRYSGRQMARVSSLSMIIFMIVPMMAPSFGQAVLLIAPWRAIFHILAGLGVIVWLSLWWWMPETLHPQDRRGLSLAPIFQAFKQVVTNRTAVGYTLGATFLTGGIFGFIHSAQPIMADVLGLGKLFPVAFACVSAVGGLSAFVNSRLVMRYGVRKVSHTALVVLMVDTSVHFLVAATGHETVWTFLPFQAVMAFCMGMVGANFVATAMEDLGHVAGMASSVQGFTNVFLAAVIGFSIGQTFNGTTTPVCFGFMAMSFLAMASVAWAERGKLFKAHHAA